MTGGRHLTVIGAISK